MKPIFFIFFSLLCHLIYSQEEYNGVLPGWANVKTRFNAVGNGKTDDTRAIQEALDAFTQPNVNYNTKENAFMVLYFPPGTYSISSTIRLRGKIGVTIIGEDPSNTVIKWEGPENDTMFWADGSAYFKISRVSWDANQRNNIEAIGLHWKNKWTDARSQSTAPVNIEISDNYFLGKFKYGISGGTVPGEGINQMDSEIAIKRCIFNKCTEAGIHIKGYNALDYWIWDCKFIECKDGINSNYGNYHVYRSYFKGSKLADVHNTNGYYTSVRGCYSEGSYTFSHDEGASSNPFKRIFQGNIIVSPVNIPIELYHLGKISLLDNTLDTATNPAVKTFIQTGSWAKGNYQILSVNNSYRDKKPITFTAGPSRVFGFSDKSGTAINKTAAAVFLEQMDKLPPKNIRKIFNIPPGSHSSKIQAMIGEAMKLKGQKVILYFRTGTYFIDKPLYIPAGADFQLIGDGYLFATLFEKGSGFPIGKPFIQVQGPSSLVIKDIQIGKFTTEVPNGNGIEFSNVDQVDAAVFVDQLYSNSQNSLMALNLNYLYLQETNSFYSYGKRITGGSLVQSGKGTARLHCFGSQFAGATVDKNASFVGKDCWWEGAVREPLKFEGAGSISIDGGMLAPVNADSSASVFVKNFAGKISLTNMYIQGAVQFEGSNEKLSILLWNIHFYHTLEPIKSITKSIPFEKVFIGLTTQCFTTQDKKCADINTVEDVFTRESRLPSFFKGMLSDNRNALPRIYKKAKVNSSSIFVSRIAIGDCKTALHFTN